MKLLNEIIKTISAKSLNLFFLDFIKRKEKTKKDNISVSKFEIGWR